MGTQVQCSRQPQKTQRERKPPVVEDRYEKLDDRRKFGSRIISTTEFVPAIQTRLYWIPTIMEKRFLPLKTNCKMCHFVLTKRDRILFEENNISIVKVPLELSLGQSVVYVLNVIGKYQETLKILHGDTLFKEIPEGTDLCVVSDEQINYRWTHSSVSDQSKVYAGYFSFSNQSLLIKKITEHKYQFMEGIESYRKEIQVREVDTDFWLDFGLVNSYYRSKSFLTTQRVFNDLAINRFSVRKSSNDKKKMLSEAMWFKNSPLNLKPFLPS